MTTSFQPEPFDPARHEAAGFHCDAPSLDAWLDEQAAAATARRTARTWVWVGDAHDVVAYYALAAQRVASFYERYGFRRIPHSLMLVQKIADIEAALRES